MARSCRTPAVDIAGVRPAPVCLSHSGSVAEPGFARPAECLASGTSRVAARPHEGARPSVIWPGDLSDPLLPALGGFRESLFGGRDHDGNLGRLSLLRSRSLPRPFQSVRLRLHRAAAAHAFLSSLHQQQAVLRRYIAAVGLRFRNDVAAWERAYFFGANIALIPS